MYIDESGDLGMNGSKYLVLSALLVDNPLDLDRIIKNMRRNKFRKQLKKAHEIKANKSSDEIRRYMLDKLNEVKNATIFYIVLEKKKIFSAFLKNNTDKLYNYVAGKLGRYIILENIDVEIRIDKSKGKQLLRDDFDRYFLCNLKENSRCGKITISHSYSHSWSGIQFADILAWACFQKFEHNNSEYIDLINLEQEVYHVW
ncbi:MAG: DUF3800 domain-containing protein [Methanosarcinales archaeon]|nr:DUF3800 domain-containing protein [Methanosarcinales archaeon]MCD4810569.1 DUF3800 domain-containing protein [Methanosarcinales archaeon]